MLRGLTPALDRLFDNRIYRAHTVDAVLATSAQLVGVDDADRLARAPAASELPPPELASRRPALGAILAGVVRAAEPDRFLEALAAFTSSIERSFPSPEHSAASGFYRSPDDFFWGGTEELVIAKGSDWCHEIARVYAALAQVAGRAARLVFLYSEDDGHVAVECHEGGVWTLVDPLAPKVYRRRDGRGIGVADLLRAGEPERREIVAGREGPYVDAAFFRFLAVAEYRIAEAGRYSYDLDRCNDFYRALLGPIWNR